MRLEKLYPGVKDELLSDYVESCSTWEGVTFSHLLDMTSGHYRSSRPHVDEDRYFWSFTTHPTAAEMTDYACSFPKEDKPGYTWVYRTSDTWLLGVAMQTFWQQKNGQNADFYADVLVPIWQELGLSELVMDSLRQDGQFYSGWGLVLRRNDIAKIALAIAQRQKTFMELFDSTMFDQATQFNGGPEGAQAGANTLKYSKGFWAWNAGRYLGCNRPVWVPTMSGFGGISVVMLPTGDVFYYFSDSGNYRYAEPVAELNKINSICRASS
jgi:hypothetical protein